MKTPQLQAVLAFMSQKLSAATGQTLEQMREGLDAAGKFAPPVPGVSYEPVETGVVPSAWALPDDAEPGRAVLFVHGGGYALGSVDAYRDLASRVALAAKAPTLVFSYHLAPEHPYPAALEDTIATYRWLTTKGGFRANKVAIVGDSAGGGMAISAALNARDRDGIDLPGAVAAMSPWTDLTCSSPSMVRDADPSMMLPYVQQMALAYLGGEDPKHPGASPLYASLAGLPPLLMQAGTDDGLLDDVEAFAKSAREAGVDVTVEIFEDMFHAFQLYAAMLPEGQQAIDSIGTFVRAKTGG